MAEPDNPYSLLLPFDTDDPQFRRGVEIGVLWANLQHSGHAKETVHWDTAGMVMRIADEKGLRFSAVPVDESWVTVAIGTAPAGG